jgi:hypothetical protein
LLLQAKQDSLTTDHNTECTYTVMWRILFCGMWCHVFDKNLHFKWMCCLNLQLSFLPWRWREHVPLKNHKFSTNLHRITLQKTSVFIVPIVATSALMNINIHLKSINISQVPYKYALSPDLQDHSMLVLVRYDILHKCDIYTYGMNNFLGKHTTVILYITHLYKDYY